MKWSRRSPAVAYRSYQTSLAISGHGAVRNLCSQAENCLMLMCGPPRSVGRPPNEWLISCKRPVKTYGPLSPLGGTDAGGARRRPRLSAALAG